MNKDQRYIGITTASVKLIPHLLGRYFCNVILFGVFFIAGSIHAQEFGTSDGLIVITATIDDKQVTYASNELSVDLNYETAEFEFKVEKASIRADDEFQLQLFNPVEIKFKGKLGLDYIRTENHPVQKFQVEGSIESQPDNIVNVIGQGTLRHLFHRNGLSCLLSVSFHLLKESMEDLQIISGPHEAIHIELIHGILDHQN
jgi:hypothetical protein